ncbi:hypothetical protein BYT27DRAFT_7256515 [Phlegmacium glaucopus]|nr:hypothetical protein BYT27DRAFT_7256515 [Phlegmacium glaucopus]
MSDPFIDARAIACEKLVDDAIKRDLSAAVLADSLKALGLKVAEAAKRQNNLPCELSPSAEIGLQDQEDQDRAVEEAAWASLQASLDSNSAPHVTPSDLSPNVLDK